MVSRSLHIGISPQHGVLWGGVGEWLSMEAGYVRHVTMACDTPMGDNFGDSGVKFGAELVSNEVL